jgi:hypothetical protein
MTTTLKASCKSLPLALTFALLIASTANLWLVWSWL